MKNEALLILEKTKYQIPLSDLYIIRDSVHERQTFMLDSISGRETIYLTFERTHFPNAENVVFSKSDSIKTELTYPLGLNPDPPFPPSNTPESRQRFVENSWFMFVLNNEIEERNKLYRLLGKDVEIIPYSEFWIEAITSFSTADIKPARNWTKILNGLQIISLLFMTTIIINSVNNNLGLSAKKKKGKKS